MLTRTSSSPARGNSGEPHKTWTVVLAGLGVFMTALDTLVVTTSLPVLRVDLHASLSSLEWTVNAYNLAFACLLLTGAALGDRFGRRRMFAVGIAIFTMGSVASALSPSVSALIAARVVQGAGAAIVTPVTLTLISEAFPAQKRGVAIGLWGGIAGLAVAVGPVIGGAIAGGINWHWIFWLNVPIGLVLAPLAVRRLSESFGPRPHLDIVGRSWPPPALSASLGASCGPVPSAGAAPRSSRRWPPESRLSGPSWPGRGAPPTRCCDCLCSGSGPSRAPTA